MKTFVYGHHHRVFLRWNLMVWLEGGGGQGLFHKLALHLLGLGVQDISLF